MITTSWMNLAILAAANEHVAAGNFDGPLSGSIMGLFVNNVTPTAQTTLAELTPATFAGYAPVNLTWGSLLSEGNGAALLVSNLANFRATDGVTPNIVYGFYVIDKTTPTPNLIGAELFSQPISVAALNEGVSIVGQFAYDGQDVGDSVIIQ